MWLLNAKTHRLEWLHDHEASTRGYAILSHTWDAEEVSFQTIQNLEVASQMKGYEKIRLTCDQALQDGLYYAWVDTCCIDKKSSAELSEAINSMFAYYQKSRICYVFLSDVEAFSPGLLQSATGSDAPEQFVQSRWFTRGWTLQELIAPDCMTFFASGWEPLGTKRTLAPLLAEITGVDSRILSHAMELDSFSIAQRMSWAAGRQTTKVEDRAYSLLGLFNVHIALLYGEGEQAFTRVQREIIHTSNDQSILLWHGSSDSAGNSAGLLAQSPDNFAGCRKIVLIDPWMHRPFELTNSGLRIALHVTEKTDQTATLVFACRYIDDFRGPIALQGDFLSRTVWADDRPNYMLNRDVKPFTVPGWGAWSPKACLLTTDTVERQYVSQSSGNSFSLWFRENDAFSRNFEMSEVHPVANWNVESSVMQWPSTLDESAPNVCKGYIVWKTRTGDSFFTLLFCITNDRTTTHGTIGIWHDENDSGKKKFYNDLLDESSCEGIQVRDIAHGPPQTCHRSLFSRTIAGTWRKNGLPRVRAHKDFRFGGTIGVVNIDLPDLSLGLLPAKPPAKSQDGHSPRKTSWQTEESFTELHAQ